MDKFTITPKVDETQEFIEISKDFSNPLDLVRESISNSYDAGATEIWISFEVINDYDQQLSLIKIKDNGSGMTKEELQAFFDLGNSTRRNTPEMIGEKGHGTKVYFNSQRIEVKTSTGKEGYHAIMGNPFRKLYSREIPTVEVEESPDLEKGTEIIIYGYNNSNVKHFTFHRLRDYIHWFTKHGSIDNHFDNIKKREVRLYLKALDKDDKDFILIDQYHRFPEESKSMDKLFSEHEIEAPFHYSKKIIKSGSLKDFPHIKYNAVFSIEGKWVKYNYNPMIRRKGYQAPDGAYTIQERYGLWVCKDNIPVQRKNEWINFKGSEYTKLHAFINCQDLKLTANRGSIENTQSEILEALRLKALEIYEGIESSEAWSEMEWLEKESSAYRTIQSEMQAYGRRIKKANISNIAVYKGVTLVEPSRESGVFTLFLLLSQIENELFPFYVIDYDTHEGIDVIAKTDDVTAIKQAKLFYVEFKFLLMNGFNHSFEHLHSIVCWDTNIKHDDVVEDLGGNQRTMIISPPVPGGYTRYFLDDPRKNLKIEVFCLKTYLKEKLGIVFTPRTSDAVL